MVMVYNLKCDLAIIRKCQGNLGFNLKILINPVDADFAIIFVYMRMYYLKKLYVTRVIFLLNIAFKCFDFSYFATMTLCINLTMSEFFPVQKPNCREWKKKFSNKPI